jgi:histone-lysine N-methyltransferase SUV39H
MKHEALLAPTTQADRLIRSCFNKTLAQFNQEILVARKSVTPYPVSLVNFIDGSSPPLNFTFTDKYMFQDESDEPDNDGLVGCEECKPNMAHHVGCEYTRKCSCLEYAAVDEDRLSEHEKQRYDRELKKLQNDPDFFMDTSQYPKRFPYTIRDQLLITFYLESRHVIYECNHLCNCGDACKTRVTHRGRKVRLEIFKTKTRGWGLKSPQDLKKGQFIDFYYGEMVRKEISEERLNQATSSEKNSYIFAMDKFKDNPVTQWDEPMHKFDIDGEFIGGPVRFMNHSCDPNCRQFVVSWNKNDPRVYNLALFALEDILAGTELTFNYIDLDEEEEDEDEGEASEDVKEIEATEDSVRCLCGAENCRGILWA